MSNVAHLTANLRDLLSQVPTQQLHAGQVAGDKPGILAGDMPVCRVRETAEGELYAALIVEAVNALPRLLDALAAPETPAASAGTAQASESDPLRQQIEAQITNTLHMLPGFKAGASGTWSKLLYAAVEPWLVGGRPPLSVEPVQPVQRQQKARSADGEKQVRLDAVMEFCNFMLHQDDSESKPNEHALETWVMDWDKEHNGAMNDQSRADHE